MKRLVVALLLAIFAVSAFAQEFTVSGEVKTGLLWGKEEDQLNDPSEQTVFGSMDDAGRSRDSIFKPGGSQGRVRFNMEYAHNNLGFKVRLNWEDWANTQKAPEWPYAFAYGNFFNDQLTVSIGKLGASPWGTGGPDLWKELEQLASSGGMRVEYKPNFIPASAGQLNIGFVLNGFNGYTDVWPDSKPITFLHYLQESVIGAAYTHQYFHVRFAIRLDSEVDVVNRGTGDGTGEVELVYRLEERILKDFIPGFSVGALGHWTGLAAKEEHRAGILGATNWLFVRYDPDLFSAQIRFGYDMAGENGIFHLRPAFYWNFLDKLIVVGTSFLYSQQFGILRDVNNNLMDVPYYYYELEPKLQVNLNSNAYVAFVYNYRMEYVHQVPTHVAKNLPPLKRSQWINLRFGLVF